MAELAHVRVEESLRIKIGEAKNLSAGAGLGNSLKDTFCKVKFDQEQIFATDVVEKSLNPFYGEDFHCEIPRQFRFLSFYVIEKSSKQEKIIGKVTLKKEELAKYHGKDHWFPLRPVHANSEVQGKAHIEVKLDECISNGHQTPVSGKHRLSLRVIECNDLSVINGSCNPYAAISLVKASSSKQKGDVKRTGVKKKTICPNFNEVFVFDIEQKGQNHDRNFNADRLGDLELSVSIWHDDSRVSREIIGGIFPGVFLGEVRIPLRDLKPHTPHRAWYFLQPRGKLRESESNLGSLRVKISYTADHVFSTHYYDELKDLLLKSPSIDPVTASSAYLLGEIVDSREEAAQPLVRLCYANSQVVQLITALADSEIAKTTNRNTIFRGNTLASKCVDELMKLVGLFYLQETLKHIIDQIYTEKRPCEIDPTRLKEGETLETNMANLESYVEQIFKAIVYSGLQCPTIMCEVFYALRDLASKHFPDNPEMKHQVVSGFIFLRFFAPAILGPRLFQLRADMPDPATHRTLTLISKTMQSLGNAVSTKTPVFGFKEEYMIPVFEKFADKEHIDEMRMFLDIISSMTQIHSRNIEVPVILKEGVLIKRAQGRRKFGLKNFKKRYFCLTNYTLSYAKAKGNPNLCEIPIEDILAVEDLQEQSFTRKYMFQVVQPHRTLYIQASNCVEEKEWKHILNKVCRMNKDRLKYYHPGAYLRGHWLCCKKAESPAEGCTPVTGALPADINLEVDTDREMERIHSLFSLYIDKLRRLQELCGGEEAYSAECPTDNMQVGDTRMCLQSISDILACIRTLEQEHLTYQKAKERQTVLGSQEFPYGDEDPSGPASQRH